VPSHNGAQDTATKLYRHRWFIRPHLPRPRPSLRFWRSWEQARLVGEYGGLGAVVQGEAGEDAVDAAFDVGLCQAKVIRF
jgi:hypothetical protein